MRFRVAGCLVCVALVIFLGVVTCKPSIPSMTALLEGKQDMIGKSLAKVGKIASKALPYLHRRDLTVDCALCGIAINEVEGMLVENMTLEAIEQFLKQDVCSWMGQFGTFCDDLIAKLPYVLERLENRYTVSAVCIDLGWCERPFTPFPDPQPVPTYTINLDADPSVRWAQVCSNPTYQQIAQFLMNTVNSILPDRGATIEVIGTVLNDFYYPKEYANEIAGCAAFLGISTGWATLFNLGYEVSDACTSIVVQTSNGEILHGRNLDFWAGMGFTDSLKNMTFIADFVKGGKTLFKATTFAGFVGVLSGIKPGAFSVTINTRFYPQGVGDMFYEIIAAIQEKNASLVSFLSRKTLTNENSFDAGVNNLCNDELIADVYYTVAGSSPGQGAVISRNRQNASDIWRLAPPKQWYLVQTNYDHWKQPPWFDNRVIPAEKVLNSIGQSRVTLTGLMQTLSTKPVLNLQTTYSILSVPRNASWQSWTRWCPFPCVE